MKTIQEQISVMQACADGKEIEWFHKMDNKWLSCINPTWDWPNIDYRIKPEPPKKKIVPYESAEEFLAAQKEHGGFIISRYGGVYFSVCSIGDRYVWLQECGYTYSELAKDWLFADGTPCGKEVEV